jgi:threonylcarbamoyladenosine tRNA methylthiotransferase MtaB
VIAGFAGETEEEHRKTLAFAEKMAFARMHVFPYSQRKGTKAAEMPGQVPKAVREKRAQELIALGERMAKEYLHAAIGSVQDVLIEHSENGWGEGYTGTYIRTRAPGKENEIVRVRITGVDDDGLAHGVSIV